MRWYKLAADVMMVRPAKLFGWRPKVEETVADIQEGRMSMTPGAVTVSKLDSIRGGWFVMDGHHRAMEMMMAGETAIPCVVNEHVPFFERPISANQNMTSDMTSLADAAGTIQPPEVLD